MSYSERIKQFREARKLTHQQWESVSDLMSDTDATPPAQLPAPTSNKPLSTASVEEGAINSEATLGQTLDRLGFFTPGRIYFVLSASFSCVASFSSISFSHAQKRKLKCKGKQIEAIPLAL